MPLSAACPAPCDQAQLADECHICPCRWTEWAGGHSAPEKKHMTMWMTQDVNQCSVRKMTLHHWTSAWTVCNCNWVSQFVLFFHVTPDRRMMIRSHLCVEHWLLSDSLQFKLISSTLHMLLVCYLTHQNRCTSSMHDFFFNAWVVVHPRLTCHKTGIIFHKIELTELNFNYINYLHVKLSLVSLV